MLGRLQGWKGLCAAIRLHDRAGIDAQADAHLDMAGIPANGSASQIT